MSKRKIISVNGDILKELIKQSLNEILVNKDEESENILKLSFTMDEVSFLEELLNRLQPDNSVEEEMIEKLKSVLIKGQTRK